MLVIHIKESEFEKLKNQLGSHHFGKLDFYSNECRLEFLNSIRFDTLCRGNEENYDCYDTCPNFSFLLHDKDNIEIHCAKKGNSSLILNINRLAEEEYKERFQIEEDKK